MPSTNSRSLRQRCSGIELLVLDVDGVLTAGGISYASHGGEVDSEFKTFHVRDGSGLKRWHAVGKRSAIITGRSSPIVAVRASELGIGHIIQGAAHKDAPLKLLLDELQLSPAAVAYIGDDFPDVLALTMVGLAAVPADACAEARFVAHYICRNAGGNGAVREVIDLIQHVARMKEEG